MLASLRSVFEVDTDSRAIAPGFRWHGVLGAALAHTLATRRGLTPWASASTVSLPAKLEVPVALGFASLVAVTSVPFSNGTLRRCLSLASGMLQGYAMGRLISFDSTVGARTALAICLGIANALDRLGALRKATSSAAIETAPAKTEVTIGTEGTIEYSGKTYKIIITQMAGNVATVQYIAKPFLFQNTETIDLSNPRLTITAPPPVKTGSPSPFSMLPGADFAPRPWAFAAGVTLSQWMLHGFGKGDAFVSGMVAQSGLVHATIPLSFLGAWYAFKKDGMENPMLGCLCVVLFVGSSAASLVLLPATTIGMVVFGITQLFKHKVVAFLAVPTDYLFLFSVLKPTTTDVAAFGLLSFVSNGLGLLPDDIRKNVQK